MLTMHKVGTSRRKTYYGRLSGTGTGCDFCIVHVDLNDRQKIQRCTFVALKTPTDEARTVVLTFPENESTISRYLLYRKKDIGVRLGIHDATGVHEVCGSYDDSAIGIRNALFGLISSVSRDETTFLGTSLHIQCVYSFIIFLIDAHLQCHRFGFWYNPNR